MILTERLTLVVCNIESVKRSEALLAQIREHEPDVVIVLQAYRARRFLHGIGGYRHKQFRGGEAKGIAVLVKHGVRIQAHRALRMKTWWTGPKAGKRHSPRVYPASVLVKGGVAFRVLGIHLPTHNCPGAQDESLKAVIRWFGQHPDAPSIAAGDWNREVRELVGTAAACGAQILSAKTKVDHALTNVERNSQQRLPTPPGAHGWSRFTITASKET